ncbi:hypothetical protein C8R47DRAFT_1081925 [Mycena vitilis]|nr:hypothetical protein C8R47DRAFT_1081925 [Mycena vitilis]
MPPKSRRPKPDPAAKRGTEDSGTYCPGISKDEKARRHRKAQAKYRAANPDIREKQRIYAAERRGNHSAAIKSKRRRGDGLKPTTAESKEAEPDRCHPAKSVSDSYSFQDPRARSYLHDGAGFDREDSEMPVAGTTGSPTRDERLAVTALAELAEGAGVLPPGLNRLEIAGNDGVTREDQGDSGDSVLERAMQLSSLGSSLVAPYFPPNYWLGDTPMAVAARAGKLPAGVAPLSRLQALKLYYGHMVDLSPVQSAQIYVAELNTGALTPPTDTEAVEWNARPQTTAWDCVTYRQGRAVLIWRTQVCKAVRAERIALKAAATGASEVQTSAVGDC